MADIVCTYNRLGQISNLTDALGERNFTYNNQFPLTSESIDGIYNKEINRIYSITGIKGRYITMGIGNAPLANYSYDAVGRVSGVNNITLGYLANSNFLSTVTRPNNVNTTWSYEANRNLVTAVENNLNNSVISNYTYTNDALGRRTEMSRSGSVFSAADTLNYSYNDRSEVTGATSNAANTTYNYAYSFDNIGNRLTANLAGTPWTYTANNLNEYSAFTINQVAETPSYDDDGNMLTRDGWTQTWNGENRLIKAEKGTAKLEFAYDYMGRRIFKKVYSGLTLTKHIRFVYDGYKLIEELNALNNNAVLRRYTWSLVGLDTPVSVYDANANATYYYNTDANKNITELTDASGAVVAHYEYSPFGKVLVANGTYASINPFRFSSEYHDDESSLVYYNYRYYSPELGRWLSRDPIGEKGGLNLYAMVRNNGINNLDHLGNKKYNFCCQQWTFVFEAHGTPEDCVLAMLKGTAYEDDVKRWVYGMGIASLGAATTATNAGVISKMGGPLAIGGIIFAGGDFLASKFAIYYACKQCIKGNCFKWYNATQRCIKKGLIYDTWESSCPNGGVLIDSIATMFGDPLALPNTSTYWQ